MNTAQQPAIVAHCDWSKAPKKRWMSVAVRDDAEWQIAQPEPVGDTKDLFERLGRRKISDGAVFIGFDFPIGLPRAYAEQTGLRDLRTALGTFGTGAWRNWFEVCDSPEEISIERPFYPNRPGGRKRQQLTDALNLTYEEMLRRCEQRTDTRAAACCLFWTLGGNQVGKGAISGWREVIAPNLDIAGLWPFDGGLHELLASRQFVLAETYPGDVYAQINLPPKSGWSKTKADGRASNAPALLHWIERSPVKVRAGLEEMIRAGFSPRSIGEDQFDAFVGLLGMLDVVEGKLSAGAPLDPDIIRWEGWILGQKIKQ